jgi:hypothetical protein
VVCGTVVSADPADPAGAASGRGIALAQNRPNPFSPRTVIEFTLERDARAKLEIFDVAGRHVATLLDRPVAAGTHSVGWDGTDSKNRSVAAGIYFYRLDDGETSRIKRMNLVR